MSLRKTISLLLIPCAMGTASNLFAHANTKPKDNLDTYSGRSYQENSSAYVDLVLSHGCDGEATVHAAVLLPNANDLSGNTSSGPDGNYAGNALMGAKAQLNANWKHIAYGKGSVPTYYLRGEQQEDVRAIHWQRGYVPDDVIELLTFRADTPKLEGCVSKLKVNIPTVQYCTHGKVKAWIKQPTAVFGEEVISAGFSPSIDVVRDTVNNPLPEECGAGIEVEAYPTNEEIDQYLSRQRKP
ncbi:MULTISPECIES: DUF1775 domain-containing protein [unclassified Ketobacter]|uniref:DUF1775 domain-containing protein n=1 Tax=unclassified Ketobacter TaxID=2639109 RepID=UPI000F1C2C2E|nr:MULTISPECIES: DUF1775 domain-containing protein [unclassified Ketobacter]RLT89280.1 MAG: DUF1775 domain-containing protein [Ketobacter sp. GenoA1]RLT95874.1 MAG: DUF1775 domain-containing protein [Ketobacter sp.]